jgi:hypothetical protein
MEVHHHSHHGKKKWTEYLWEFLMLFLAVFCGFLAEYQLEHKIEKDREKQYIKSLLADLENDQQILSQHIQHLQLGIFRIDTLINMLNAPSSLADNTGQLYYLARVAPRLDPLATNSRTFDQLKNSGSFRLIHNIGTSNRIMSYYEKFPLIRLLESMNATEFNEYKKVAAKIFDPAIFLKMSGKTGGIQRSNENPPLRTSDRDLLQELSVFSVYLRGNKTGILQNDEALKANGLELIEFLKNEYHLK